LCGKGGRGGGPGGGAGEAFQSHTPSIVYIGR